jgi:hypothetical protein
VPGHIGANLTTLKGFGQFQGLPTRNALAASRSIPCANTALLAGALD